MVALKNIASLASAAVLAAACTAGAFAEDEKKAEIGEKAPSFTLTDTEGEEHALEDYTAQGKIVVLEWFNVECPLIVKHHERFDTMETLASEYADRDVVWIAINTGAEGKQGAGRAKNAEAREKWSLDFPILLDESGDVGRMYGSKVTPHMFIIDKEGVLRYDGAIDNNPSAYELGDTNYVRQALDEILAGEEVSEPVTKPYGCSVKY